MKKTLLLLLVAALAIANHSCDKCKDIECFSPPPTFSFQLLDKDSGEDLVANGSFEAEQVKVFDLANNKVHSMLVSPSTDSTAYFFIDQEIGWETGDENASFELRLNDSTVFPFTYLTLKKNEDCCTSFELKEFEMEGVEQSLMPQQGVFQLRF